jgi:hypothetical protein
LQKIDDEEINDFSKHQIVKIGEEPFLVDSPVVVNRKLYGSELRPISRFAASVQPLSSIRVMVNRLL